MIRPEGHHSPPAIPGAAAAIVLGFCLPLPGAETAPADVPAASRAAMKEERMAWWREARFGLFVHWGVYAVPAGEYRGKTVPHLAEWIMRSARIPREEYRAMAASFNPREYDAGQWVAFAKRCGARYMVVTAKHHDGFALFDSKVSDWNAVEATAAKRDLLGELAVACRRAGMPLGFHYSQAQDWWHPGGASYGKPWDPAQAGDFDAYLDRVAVPQVRELCERYGPVACLFFDTPAKMTPERARRIEAVLPARTVVNDRLGSMVGWDYRCAENKLPAGESPAADWELCRTMNGTWGFRREPTQWIPARDLLRELVRTASLGGNYLLNVGPDADGRFPPQAVERLDAIGAWLALHGDSVYGTRASPLPKQGWNGASTLKPGSGSGWKLFLHVFDWPADGSLRVTGLADRPASVRLIGSAETPAVDGGPGLWTIRGLPASPVHPDVSVVELGFPAMPGVAQAPAETSAGQPCVLSPADASLSKEHIRLGRSSDDPSQALRDWKGPDGTASWRISLPAQAAFSAELDVSSPALPANLTGMLRVNGREAAPFVVPATGKPARRRITVPAVTLPAGFPALSVELSGTASDPPLALHSITLTPAGR